MPDKKTSEDMNWGGFFAVLVGVALVVMMLFAMFSTQDRPSSHHGSQERYGPGEQLENFQKNVERSIHRGLREIM